VFDYGFFFCRAFEECILRVCSDFGSEKALELWLKKGRPNR
jgi:hypothetical protein